MVADTRPAMLAPQAQAQAWDDFRVAHPGERLVLLRRLRDGSVPVSLSAPDGSTLNTTLWAVDDVRQRLNFSVDGGAVNLPPMIDADEVVAVAYLESVKLQFDLHDLLLVHGSQGTILQAALPNAVYRFQRRGAYRVRTLERGSPTAHLRHPAIPDMPLALRVLDVSIGGCSLHLPDDVPPLQPGTRLHAVRVQLDADTRFAIALQCQHVSSVPGGGPGLRIGCEWMALGGDAGRALQRYIDLTQKRRRLLGAG